jgi:hypothetical protein
MFTYTLNFLIPKNATTDRIVSITGGVLTGAPLESSTAISAGKIETVTQIRTQEALAEFHLFNPTLAPRCFRTTPEKPLPCQNLLWPKATLRLFLIRQVRQARFQPSPLPILGRLQQTQWHRPRQSYLWFHRKSRKEPRQLKRESNGAHHTAAI